MRVFDNESTTMWRLAKAARPPERLIRGGTFILALAGLVLIAADAHFSFALSLTAISAALALLALNALFAGARLAAIARAYGHDIAMPVALRANAVGAGLAQVTISYLGHTTGRAAVLRHAGVPPTLTVEIGLIEKVAALATLGAISLISAGIVFGTLTIGDEIDSARAIGASIVFISATATVGILVFRPFIARAVARAHVARAAAAFIPALLWSLVTHLAMLAAYAALLQSVAPLGIDSIAACAIIMFAAAIPISFGGWGVRELSAVAALAVVGVEPGPAIQIGVAIGVGSLLVQLLLWLLAGTGHGANGSTQLQTKSADHHGHHGHAGLLFLALPAMISVAIAFSLHVPTQAGLLNVNLADPLALVALAAFAAHHVGAGTWPQWSMRYVNATLAIFGLMLVVAAIIGYLDFGFSPWAWRNRVLGYVFLLGYVAAGAMCALAVGRVGLRLVLSALCITMVCVTLYETVQHIGVANRFTLYEPSMVAGFAQNPNAQAMLLLASLAAVVLVRHWLWSTGQLAILLVGIVLTQSRSGVGAAIAVLAVATILDWRMAKRVAPALILAGALLVLATRPLDFTVFSGDGVSAEPGTELSPGAMHSNASSDALRLETLQAGYDLWHENPVLGAGLGAHYEATRARGEPVVIHSTAVWLAAEFGTAGLLVVLLSMVALAWHWTQRAWHGDRTATAGVLLLVGAGVMALVHDVAFQRVIWFAAGALLVAPQRHSATSLTNTGP